MILTEREIERAIMEGRRKECAARNEKLRAEVAGVNGYERLCRMKGLNEEGRMGQKQLVMG